MNSSVEIVLPGFITACAGLHAALVPVAMALLVLAFAFAYWHGPMNGPETVLFLTKIFLVIILITRSHALINDAQAIIANFVEQHVPARAENIAALYQQKLDDAQNAKDRENKGFFKRLFSASFFEAIIYAVLMLITWAAMAVTFFVFIVQKIALMLCWTLTPLLFPLFVFNPLAGIAWRHLTRLIGILMWPLALSLASCVSQGILNGMVNDSFLKQFGVAGTIGYGLNNLLALAVLAVWIIGSSIVAPLYIQRIVGHGAGAAATLLRANDLTLNVGVSTLASAIVSRFSHSSSSKLSSTQPVPSMPVDTPPPTLTPLAREFYHEPNPNDPTGELAVDAELKNLTGLA